MDHIKWNNAVILKRNNVLKAATLQKGKKVSFEKFHFYPDNAVDQTFNSLYRSKYL